MLKFPHLTNLKENDGWLDSSDTIVLLRYLTCSEKETLGLTDELYSSSTLYVAISLTPFPMSAHGTVVNNRALKLEQPIAIQLGLTNGQFVVAHQDLDLDLPIDTPPEEPASSGLVPSSLTEEIIDFLVVHDEQRDAILKAVEARVKNIEGVNKCNIENPMLSCVNNQLTDEVSPHTGYVASAMLVNTQLAQISDYRDLLIENGMTADKLALAAMGQLMAESAEVWGDAYKALSYPLSEERKALRIKKSLQELGDVHYCLLWTLLELNRAFGTSYTLDNCVAMSCSSVSQKQSER